MNIGYIVAIILALMWLGFILLERGKKPKKQEKQEPDSSMLYVYPDKDE